jgi:hypothetical protein
MLALRSHLPPDQVPVYGQGERLAVVDLHLLARAMAELVRGRRSAMCERQDETYHTAVDVAIKISTCWLESS